MNSNTSKELSSKKTMERIEALFDPHNITSVPGIKKSYTNKVHKTNVKLLSSLLTRLKSKDNDSSQSTASKDSIKKECPIIFKTESKREKVSFKKEVIEITSIFDDNEVIDINAIQ